MADPPHSVAWVNLQDDLDAADADLAAGWTVRLDAETWQLPADVEAPINFDDAVKAYPDTADRLPDDPGPFPGGTPFGI